MKKNLVITSLMLLFIILTACNPISSETNSPRPEGTYSTNDNSSQSDQLVILSNESETDQSNQLATSLAFRLALGSLKLEDTKYPLNLKQAGEMLFLWKAVRSLSQSETASREEIDAVLYQIQNQMSQDQLAALENMEFSFQDMREITQRLGIEFGGGGFDNLSPEQQATIEAARASGQFPQVEPGGGPGFPGEGSGGGPGGGPGFGLNQEQRQTAIAERGGLQRADLGLPLPFLEAIIEFLEQKTS